MTLETFLRKLGKTDRRWRLINGMIRLGTGQNAHCPLSAVAGTEPCAITSSLKKLKLDGSTGAKIVAAADYSLGLHRKTTFDIRLKLFKACGLKVAE